ncbi:MAG: metalloregulator ArsR/SmtB family transcription factor [Lachnospiraceae bacterium]
MNSNTIALICRALGDPNRLQIIQMLSGGEKCACKLLEKFEISQPTLSHHMKILCDCTLVTTRKEGKWSHYSLDYAVFFEFLSFFKDCLEKKEGETSCH